MSHTPPERVMTSVDTNVVTLSRMPRDPKKQRTYRAGDDVYDPAMAEAERRGEYLSEAIVRFLEMYAAGNDPTSSSRS